MRTMGMFILAGALLCFGASPIKRVSGTALYSFSEDHNLIQTTAHIFRIRRDLLDEEQKRRLNQIGSTIAISIPAKSIDMAWRFIPKRINPETHAVTVADALTDEAKVRDGILELRGTPLSSFQEGHYLIRVGKFVYRVKKSGVDVHQRLHLGSIGSQIQLKIAPSAVDFAWAVDGGAQVKKINQVPTELPDEFRKLSDSVLIRGQLLPSLDDPHYIVQVGSNIYWIKKSNIKNGEIDISAKAGSQVSLKVPIEKVELSWSIDNDSRPNANVISAIKKIKTSPKASKSTVMEAERSN